MLESPAMPDTLVASNVTSTHLYREVKNRIMRGLEAGEWPPGTALPSEARLAQRFSVSVGTIRKAIDELVAGKIVVRRQGRGTFVATHTEDRTLFHFFHVVGRDGVRVNPVTELLAFHRARADPETAAALGIGRGERVICIRNRLRLQGRPVVLDDITIAQARFPDLTEAVFAGREGTIYGLYQARYGINVIRIVERLSATTADAATANELGVAAGAPLLRIRRRALTYNDAPVELRVSLVDTERHDYLNDLLKKDDGS